MAVCLFCAEFWRVDGNHAQIFGVARVWFFSSSVLILPNHSCATLAIASPNFNLFTNEIAYSFWKEKNSRQKTGLDLSDSVEKKKEKGVGLGKRAFS